MTHQEIIDQLYPVGTLRRDIYLKHATQVADKAVEIARSRHLDIDLDLLREAAMLHDIGIALTDAPSIDCHGTEPYLRHGYLGAALLRSHGVDERIVRVAERHTGAGITVDDIKSQNLPLPMADFSPVTLLERLVCYADKFYSKSGEMLEKPLERVRASMAKFSPDTLERFETLHREFGDSQGRG